MQTHKMQNYLEQALLSALLVATLLSPITAWGLGRHPGDDNRLLPGSTKANAVVRVNNDGSGTVFSIKRDRQGDGGWLCVLTADHVNAPIGSGIGFGSGNNLPYEVTHRFRAPNRVDLAVLGVRVPNLGLLPQMLLPSLSDVNNNLDLIVAGYGDKGDVRQNTPNAYVATLGSYGTFRSGKNTIDAVEAGGSGPYQNQVIRFDLDFTRNPNQNWPPQFGEAYLFSGDSGGPSFQAQDLNGDGDTDDPGEWRLVGVHSYSRPGDFLDTNGDGQVDIEVVYEGYNSFDVHVWTYRGWIGESCALVPEPASLIALAVGLAGLAYRRRKR